MITRAFCRLQKAAPYDVIVLGGGPGGYVAAIRAAQLGMRVACVDDKSALGGTCLNVGWYVYSCVNCLFVCVVFSIPSKILLNATHKYTELQSLKKLGISSPNASIDLNTLMGFKTRTVSGLTRGIESLLKKYGADYIKGYGSLISNTQVSVNGLDITGKHIVLATGSYPSGIPGISIDGEKIVTSDHAIAFADVPERLVVIGGGVIGLELGSVWARLGSQVTVIDRSSNVLSTADRQVSAQLSKQLTTHEGMTLMTNSAHVEVKNSCVWVGETEIPFDKLLIATGRKPNTQKLKDIIDVDKFGFVQVNEFLQTNKFSNVYAIGDIAPGPMLAHKASEEAIAVIDHISDPSTAHFPNALHIPSVVYTNPEVAWVGYTEEELIAKKIKYRKGFFPFMANSRSRCNGKSDGFVKILVDDTDDKILGAHVISEHAGELIAPLVVGMTYGATSRDIANVSHAHPTEHEAIKEACLAAHFKPIHF